MGEFFHGWRRKVGLLTLVMALALSGGWVSTLNGIDRVRVAIGKNTYDSLVSYSGYIAWQRSYEADFGEMPTNADLFVRESVHNSVASDAAVNTNGHDAFGWKCKWHAMDFAIWEVKDKGGLRMSALVIPYWTIVIPLTLISTWLLLAKPHKSTLKKISEPVPVEGT